MRQLVRLVVLLGLSCQPKAGEPPAPSPAARPATPAVAAVRSEATSDRPAESGFDDQRIDWTSNPVMQVLGSIADRMTDSAYSHGTYVDERRGIYRFDCSGMVEWVLARAAPRARLGGRPLARDFERQIAAERRGWRRVLRVEDAQPGDVIAWRKPDLFRSLNTGHVAFIVLAPAPVPGFAGAFLVRIADSSSLLHDADTRLGRSGFGLGTILVETNPVSGAPTAYGWSGLKWRTFETQIAIGRPLG